MALDESDELNEMYRLYGIAAHNCCNIEYRVAHLLLGPEWNQLNELNAEHIRKVSDDIYAKPLGALLRKYKQHYSFSDKSLQQMQLVLDKRNYLVHRFFGSYGQSMMESETIPKMIAELREMIGLFQAASMSLERAINGK